MRRRHQLNLTALLFLLFTLGAAYLIWESGQRQDSFEIGRDGETQSFPSPAPAQAPTPRPEPAPAPTETDLEPYIKEYYGREIIRISTTKKAVALTFDAGANAQGVDKVLPILEQNGIKGTFFLTGKFIEKYPDQVKEIIATGGDLGNHTYDHPYLTRLTAEGIAEEITKAEDALAVAGGKFKPFLRSPYGDRNAATLMAISDAHYLNIRWTVDSLGWKGTSGGQSAITVRDKVLKSAGPGAIIMMHLGNNPDDKTHLDSEALPEIIAGLKAQGYEFKTLSELLTLED